MNICLFPWLSTKPVCALQEDELIDDESVVLHHKMLSSASIPDSPSATQSQWCRDSEVDSEQSISSLSEEADVQFSSCLGDNHAAVSVEVFTISGQLVFGPTELPGQYLLQDLLRMLKPPFGCSPILLRKSNTSDSDGSDGVLHNLDAILFDLVPDELISLQLTVVWQPWLQKGEVVSVAQDFQPRVGHPALPKGLQGKVVKMYRPDDTGKATVLDNVWEEGDALISFSGEGGLFINKWVPRLHICNLARSLNDDHAGGSCKSDSCEDDLALTSLI